MNTKAIVQAAQLLFTLSGAAFPAAAAIVTFTDRATFLSATGADDVTGPLPNLGFRGQQPTTVGGITFIPIPGHGLWFGQASGPDWTPLLPGHDLAIDGEENMDVSFARSFSFGFDIVEPTEGHGGNSFVDSSFTITLFDGTSQVGRFTLNPSNDVAAFIGVWSDTAFDRAEIRETVTGIDNEFFGHFYSGSSSLPSLLIRKLASPQVEVSWSTNVIGFGLQSTTNLAPVSWSSITNTPQLADDRFTVVVPVTSPQQFFRLSKP